ncbi:helix-turn-helix transcriptional regulator [Lacticaseibacillus porcinae]|uniref:helix-turn-helix transcriptional regulator n=1 Tax=Lacticaseibacillus porcinae TaxID=1123687 RepID=UPI000F791CD7|nr:helix-turn-helix transcriptional regulator [Lacticaseibacillus porcinae]
MTDLGTLFQNFRSARQISLRQAGQGLAAATISRFERGIVDIKAPYAFALMTNIGLDATELDFLRGETFPDPYPAFIRGDFKQLHDDAEAYLAQHPHNSLTDLIEASLPFLIQPAKPTPALEQQLADLLAYPLLWSQVEATILIAVLPYASVNFCQLIWRRIGSFAVAHPNWEQLTVATSALTLLQHEPLQKTIHADLVALLEKNRRATRNLSTKPLLTAGTILGTSATLDSQLDALEALHADSLVDYLKRVSNAVSHPVPAWHNDALKDHYQPKLEIHTDQSMMTGPVLRLLRKQRGLTLEQVATDWNVSTQSRFEAGKIDLSFTKLLTLLDTLMLPLSRAVVGLDRISSFEHLQRQFADMGEDITHHTKADFLTLRDRFKANHSDMPSGLLDMQLYAVETSIARFAPTLYEGSEDAPELSTQRQDAIINYVNSLPALSHLDALLLVRILPGVDSKHISAMTQAILSKCQVLTPAESVLYQRMMTLACGPLYFQKGDLLRNVANFFTYHSRFDADWRIQRHCYHVKLLANVFERPDDQTTQRAHQFLEAFKTVIHFPNLPFMPDRWMQFAIDRDYDKLEH